LNAAVILAVLAGVAIAVQVTANAVGLRVFGVGALIGISALTTSVIGFAIAFSAGRPEFTGRAVGASVVSGLLGAFILGSVVVASEWGGLARTLSLVLGAQLIAGLIIDRLGLFGPAGQLGPVKVVGIALILVGGLLLVGD
jgi:bacterial/archaeal transporter family-2 protein